jgi:phosphohistidine phosphatase
MRLFISRHAEAGFDAPTDTLRPITERGAQQTTELAERYLPELASVSTIWCSDLLRARQTAEIIAKLSGKPLEKRSFLSPDKDPQLVMRNLSDWVGGEDLLLVSHQPLVGSLVSLLCAGHVYEPHPFVTSEVVVLECDVIGSGLATLVSAWRP